MATKRTDEDSLLPKGRPGRKSKEQQEQFDRRRERFCRLIIDIAATLDFKMSTRGWCYILEQHGLRKGNFDKAETEISRCRKLGALPLDICCEDEARSADHLEDLDNDTPQQYAEWRVNYEREHGHERYTPISFWDDQKYYVEMAVEKIDLASLFSSICEEYRIALTNISGWADINSRVAMMRRFQEWEQKGKRCVLLYCGDHDPIGLHISENLRKQFADIKAVGWDPSNLIIDRFGLNAPFIRRHRLSWIENLETGSGKDLGDPKHPQHWHKQVQDYIKKFGVRKVEANALVVQPEAGRQLCRDAIARYVPDNAVAKYERKLRARRNQARAELARLLPSD